MTEKFSQSEHGQNNFNLDEIDSIEALLYLFVEGKVVNLRQLFTCYKNMLAQQKGRKNKAN